MSILSTGSLILLGTTRNTTTTRMPPFIFDLDPVIALAAEIKVTNLREDPEVPRKSTKNKKNNTVEQQKQEHKELRAYLRLQKKEEKLRKQEEEAERKRMLKNERVFVGNSSRRAREDARKEQKRAERIIPETCAHGIAKCRICNPAHAKINYRTGVQFNDLSDLSYE